MAELSWFREIDGSVTFSGRISVQDLMAITDNFDRLQLDQPCETAADFLLDAELVFRRAVERAAIAKASADTQEADRG